MEHSILPPINHMPGSYADAIKLISPYLVKPLSMSAQRNVSFSVGNTIILIFVQNVVAIVTHIIPFQ